MPRDLLTAEGVEIGRLHVATLMKRMRIEAIYRKPNTNKPAPGHKIYPYFTTRCRTIRGPARRESVGQRDVAFGAPKASRSEAGGYSAAHQRNLSGDVNGRPT
jgi:hypothetical protein